MDEAEIIHVPPGWRIIGTMNVFDKALLFEMSYALMRRFAFIEVPSPDAETFRALIEAWAEGDQIAEDVAVALLGVRRVKDVGPAVYRDIARYVRQRRIIETVSKGQLVFDSFYSFSWHSSKGSTMTTVAACWTLSPPRLAEPLLAIFAKRSIACLTFKFVRNPSMASLVRHDADVE